MPRVRGGWVTASGGVSRTLGLHQTPGLAGDSKIGKAMRQCRTHLSTSDCSVDTERSTYW